MIVYCKKCGINWRRLWQETVGEETYEFCPTCKSAIDLTDATDIVGYIRNPITGKIINPDSGLELIRPSVPAAYTIKKRRQRVYDETLEQFHARREDLFYEHIARYQSMCMNMTPEDASIAAGPWPQVERMYHYIEVI
jgi:hypothetical protein